MEREGERGGRGGGSEEREGSAGWRGEKRWWEGMGKWVKG